MLGLSAVAVVAAATALGHHPSRNGLAVTLALAAVALIVARGVSLLKGRRPWWDQDRDLERAVIDGSWDRSDPKAAQYVARLTSRRTLRGLARGIRIGMNEVPTAARNPAAYVGSAADDPIAYASCLALAAALERAVEPRPDVVVRIVRLLRDPDSSLSGSCGRRLTEDVNALLFRLQPEADG